MAKHYVIYIVSLLLSSALWGQTATGDTLRLSEVSVTALRLQSFAVGSQLVTIDSNLLEKYQALALAQLLSFESPVYIKNYGPGSLSTTSLRGGNASHTAVTWNGFNLNSPLTGQLDMSLLPLGLTDQVQMQYGASTALWGSGAVGGAIHLNNTPDFTPGWKLQGSLERRSFESLAAQASAGYSSKRYSGQLTVWGQQARNNFSFNNPVSGREEEQRHADFDAVGLVAENFFRLRKNEVISLHAWWQRTDRNIPPTLLQAESKASQKDESLRFTSEWRKEKNRFNYAVRAALFDEKLTFTDPLSDLADTNNSLNLIAETEVAYRFNSHHKILLGVNYTHSSATVDAFETTPQQQRFALFTAYHLRLSEDLSASLSLREELLDGQALPLTYTLGMAYQLLKNLEIKAQFSRVYRIPTLNDRYWNPGGNPNLLAESGLDQEVSLNYRLEINKQWILEFQPALFNRRLKNQIIWLPAGGLWQPQNLLEVWSRGFETQTNLKVQSGEILWQIGAGTSYVVATNEKSKTENDASLGRQLIYTPIYSGNARLSIQYRNWDLYYVHQYNGYTYTASDHSDYLEPYHLANARLTYTLKEKLNLVSFYFQLNNIWNEDYQVVQNRPMPLLNYAIGISLSFKPNIKFKNHE